MRVLLITHFDGLLGSSRSLLDLVHGLRIHGVEPYVVLPKGGRLQDQLENTHVSTTIVPFPWWMTKQSWSPSSIWKFLNESKESLEVFQKALNDWDVDLVYSNSSVFPIGRMLAARNHLPHIWHIREFGNLDFSFHYIFPKWLCKQYIRSSQAVICNSQAVRKHVFNSWTSDKLHVIYNGVATKEQFDHLKIRAKTRSQNGPYTFLFIGSISPRKGPEVAIRATAELISRGLDIKVKIAGSGREDFINYCRSLVESLGISAHIDFSGFISDPYDAYFNSDCLLMCSEYEAFGRVTAEAMSACLPVIGKNSGGTPEIIVDGETGFLYNTFNELVEAMMKLGQNPELGQKMGLAGWQRARDLFNIEDYSANVYRVIQSVMEKR